MYIYNTMNIVITSYPNDVKGVCVCKDAIYD